MHVEVLTFVIFEVLHMPNPLPRLLFSFLGPHFLVLLLADNFIGFDPVLRDIFLVAPADRAALRLAQFLHVGKRALGVKVKPNQLEEFGFDQLMQRSCSFIIQWTKHADIFLTSIFGELHNKRNKHNEEREHEDTKCSIRHIDYLL